MTVGVVAADRVGRTVAARPRVGLAGNCRHGRVYRVVDGQVQRIYLRTAVGVIVAVGIVTAGGVSRTVAARPCVSFTSNFRHGRVYRVVDGQVQRIDLRAAVGVIVTVEVVTAGRVGRTVTARPCVGLAGNCRHSRVNGVVDGQMQCHRAVRAVYVGEVLYIVAGNGVGLLVPCVGLASRGSKLILRRLIDGQVQGIHLRTAVGVIVGVGVVTAFCIGLRGGIHMIPRVGFNSRSSGGQVAGVVDGQVQCYHTVAAGRIGQRVGRRGGALSVGHTVDPLITVASCLLVNADGGVFDGQVQRINLNTTVGILVAVGVVAALSIVLCGGIHMGPCVGVTLGNRHGRMNRSVDGEGHGHHRVTAIGSRQDGILCASFVE